MYLFTTFYSNCYSANIICIEIHWIKLENGNVRSGLRFLDPKLVDLRRKKVTLTSFVRKIDTSIGDILNSVTIRLCINREELSCVFSNGNLSTKPLNYRLAKRLVFRKVRKALGLDRCTRCYTGAAPITKDTLEFFLSLDIPLFELYGMSESSGPHTISLPDAFRLTRYCHLHFFSAEVSHF